MHITLYAFLAIAVFTSTPNLQAAHLKDFLFKPRLPQPHVSVIPKNNQSYFNPALGLSIGIAFAAHVAAHESAEQERAPFSIKNLNYKNPQEVLEGFAKATESEKKELAQLVAYGIALYSSARSVYSMQNINDFLGATSDEVHHMLVRAIAKNISLFTPKEIILILTKNPQSETHKLIATALKDNYTHFTSYSWWGIELSSDKHWRKEYAAILKAVKPEHQLPMLEPILKNREKYNVFHLLYYADPQHRPLILNALKESKSLDLSLYSGTEMLHLLKLTHAFNQKIVAQAIAKEVGRYTSWHFHGLFKLCTEESKQIILNGIATHLAKNQNTYDAQTLHYIAQMAQELPECADSKTILAIIQKSAN